MSGRRILGILVMCLAPAVVDADIASQRAAFGEALYAAKRGDAATVERHRPALSGYPLTPYLDYYLLGNTFEQRGNADIDAFIDAWPGLPVSRRLRSDWLRHLAAHGRWETFLQAWRPQSDTVLRCHRVTAYIRTGRAADPVAAEEAVDLWLAGRSQPDACDPVFAWLEESGRMTPALVQARMRLALHARQFGLAGWLARRLDDTDRDYVQRWRRMQQAPARHLATHGPGADTDRERALLIAGLERLAWRQPAEARMHWQRLSENHAFTEDDRRIVLRIAGLIAAQRHLPEAGDWLGDVAGSDVSVDEWRVRSALRNDDWPAVLDALDALPAIAREQAVWAYWRARALEKVGEQGDARALYERVAGENGYHAWLAAARIGHPHRPRHTITQADEAAIAAIAERPAILRAREFLALGMLREARAEWAGAMHTLRQEELVQAALLAHRWQWHAQAITTLGAAREFSDLEIRYPLVYAQQILSEAERHGLDPALMYSLVRSESLFTPDARSGAGALGLMQLMPGTGRDIASRLGLRVPNERALLDPATNVRLGSAYFGRVLDRFDNHEVLATAAYNAGPNRVQQWIPRGASLPADVWVETIPYNETRGYVRQVVGGSVVFDWRLGREARDPATRMRDVPAYAE